MAEEGPRSEVVSRGIGEHKKSCKEMVPEDREMFVEELSVLERTEGTTQK